MAMYYHHQGSSEPNNYRGQIQTLHLMNPNYVTFSNDTQNHHQDSTTMFFNPAIVNTTTADNQFVGFALNSNDDRVDHNTIPRLDNNSTLELLAYHGTRSQTNIAEVGSPPQGLYLISQQSSARNNDISTEESFQKSNTNYPNGQDLSESTHVYPVQGVILGSKYLKAAQELLDEVASVGNKDSKIFDGLKDKAIIKSVTVKQPSNDEVDQHEVTTAQIQEMKMKKAKLNVMLDEVDQRCRHYHRQMQTTISWFEREAGMGSSSTYTQLALKTILKQFKRLKSAIISQIRSINKSLGDEHNGSSNDPFEGSSSRLKFINHHHQLRRSNAWRPQRGLPETAVSVLRAWLFEHFLHPYPKDSDKTMMAKQTGLTRNQVSNWFINARVRLWKPMVEEMYSEEMKNQEQQVVNDVRSDKDSSSSPPSSRPLLSDENNVKQSHHHQRNKNPTSSSLIPSPMAEISGSSITSSPSSLLRPQLFPEKIDNLKRPRNMMENSPSSILSSVEIMELKEYQTTMKGYFQGNHHHHPHDYLSTPTMNNSDHHHHHHHHRHGNYYRQQASPEFGYNCGIGELSRFNTEHNQANNGHFSLSLALPPLSGNYGMPSSHRDDSFAFANGVDDAGATNDEYGRSSSHTSSAIAANYEEILDLYKGKRYAKMLPPDFVA